MLLSRSEPGDTPTAPVRAGCLCDDQTSGCLAAGAAPRTTDVRSTRHAMTICVDSICAVRGLPTAGRL
jgi:hypothetical protein